MSPACKPCAASAVVEDTSVLSIVSAGSLIVVVMPAVEIAGCVAPPAVFAQVNAAALLSTVPAWLPAILLTVPVTIITACAFGGRQP